MKKSGRHRLDIPRAPSGRISRAGLRDDGYSGTAVKRLLDAELAEKITPLWGSPLGRMRLANEITSGQCGAGLRWRDLHEQYLRAIRASGGPKSILVGAASRGEEPDPDSVAGQEIAGDEIKIVKRFEKALGCLQSHGRDVESAVRRLCEGLGASPNSHQDKLHAKAGLSALEAFWQGEKAKNSRRR